MAATKSHQGKSHERARAHSGGSKSKSDDRGGDRPGAGGKATARQGRPAERKAAARPQPGHSARGSAARERASHKDEAPEPKSPQRSKRPESRQDKDKGRQQADAGRNNARHDESAEKPNMASQRGGEQGRKTGGVSQVVGSLKQHPVAATAAGAGAGLILAAGVRRAIAAAARPAGGEDEDEDRNAGRDDARRARDQGDESDEQGAEDEDEPDRDEDPEARGEADQGEEDENDESSENGSGQFVRHPVAAISRYGREGLSRATSAFHRGYDRGRQAGANAWERYPLLLCGAAFGAGAAVAMLFPPSRLEDRLMGNAADRVNGRIHETRKRLVQEGKSLVMRAVGDAVKVASREAEREGLSPDRLGRKVKRVVSHVRDAVGDALEGD